MLRSEHLYISFFFFNDTATTEIYTLSLHDALPISFEDEISAELLSNTLHFNGLPFVGERGVARDDRRSEEHTSELQSHLNLVCRLLLEKKKKTSAEWCDVNLAFRCRMLIVPRCRLC